MFSNTAIDQGGKGQPKKWEDIPGVMKKILTFNGKISTDNWYFDDAGLGNQRTEATVFSEELVNQLGEFYPKKSSIILLTLFLAVRRQPYKS